MQVESERHIGKERERQWHKKRTQKYFTHEPLCPWTGLEITQKNTTGRCAKLVHAGRGWATPPSNQPIINRGIIRFSFNSPPWNISPERMVDSTLCNTDLNRNQNDYYKCVQDDTCLNWKCPQVMKFHWPNQPLDQHDYDFITLIYEMKRMTH